MKGNINTMKKLWFIIVLALVAGLTSVQAQGPIQVINGGTNMAVVSSTEATATTLIAGVYAGQAYTLFNGGGGTNGFNMNLPSGAAFTIFTNSSGGVSITQKSQFTPSGYRVSATFFNPWTNSIGIKLSGNYPVGATPDRILLSSNTVTLYFEDGYNGPISARSLTVDGGGSLTYSDWGN